MSASIGDSSTSRKKQATLFDAVAGRVGYEGFLTEERPSRWRDTASNTDVAVPPEEVLFRRKGAPLRFEEEDVYFQDRHLGPRQLPESDLLKSLHAYTADYYHNSVADHGKSSLRSLDETALLALGILLEEAATEALGRTGDLALVEGVSSSHEPADNKSQSVQIDGRRHRSVIDRSRVVRRTLSSRGAQRELRDGSMASATRAKPSR